MNRGVYEHDAFISYSTIATGQIGAALETALEALGRRWDEPRARDVFRDVSDQPATADLAAELLHHLEGSRFLVFIASHAAAASRWVRDEIRHWLQTRGVENLLLVIADGNLTWDLTLGRFDAGSSLPPELMTAFLHMPKWVDLRWAAADFDPTGDRFLDNVADLAASIAGSEKDELVGLHWREYRKGLARRLAEDAHTVLESSSDLSLLLASAATVLDDCPTTRRSLAYVLEATSSLQAATPLEEETTILAESGRPGEFLLGFADGTVAHWDGVGGGESKRYRPGPAARVTALDCPEDGRYVAVGYDDGTAVVVSDGNVVQSWPGDGLPVRQLALQPLPLRVVCSGGNGRVRVLAPGTQDIFDGFTSIRKLRFGGADEVLAYDWNALYRLDLSHHQADWLCTLPALPRPGPVAYTASGDRVVYTQLDGGGINISTLPESDEAVFLQGPPGVIDAVAIDADGTYMAEAAAGEVLLWRADSPANSPVRRFPVSVGEVRQVVLGKRGAWVAVLGDRRFELHGGYGTTLCRQLTGHETDVPSAAQTALDVAFSPEDGMVASITNPVSAGDLPSVTVWSTATAAAEGSIKVAYPLTLEFLDESSVRVVDQDGQSSTWDLRGHRSSQVGQSAHPRSTVLVENVYEQGRLVVRSAGHEIDSIPHPTGALRWCLDQSSLRLALSSARGLLTVRDVEARADLWSIPLPSCDDLTFSPDAELLAVVTARGQLLLVDVVSGQIAARLYVHKGPLHIVRFSHAGRQVVVASPGGPVTLVNTDIALWQSIAQRRASRTFSAEELVLFGLDRIHLQAIGDS